ncbi:hypothetical protein VMCG_03572 [Cytospora schulzeri]|uniref:CENP-V/GFA domain-containing protein n=1 Tax=Cytospora schulzeri TaxID=448051 RepID=A0A423WWE5_9PEZI|nr:hypothetical protein VMCG_03572 [Valsa malicola]
MDASCQCGAITFKTPLEKPLANKNVVSVKGGCLEGLDWNKAIHIWTKSAMIPIPEGAESYSEESEQTAGYSDSQETLDQPGMLTGSGGDPDQERGKGQVEGLCELSGPGTVWTGNAAGC